MADRRYYTPRPLRIVPGVRKRTFLHHQDGYQGTQDALIAAGLATADMFPGQPGMPRTMVSYQPEGRVPRAPKCGTRAGRYLIPGYIVILRKLDGLFEVLLTVSYEEQDRRVARIELEGRAELARHYLGTATKAPAEPCRPACAPRPTDPRLPAGWRVIVGSPGR